MSIFEQASRAKLRFPTSKGLLSVEELWDLPLLTKNGVSLDDIARELNRQLKNDDDVSFVIQEKKRDNIIQLKFDVVRHIIETRLAEDKAKKDAHSLAQQEQRILAVLAEKDDEVLRSKTPEELRAMLSKKE